MNIADELDRIGRLAPEEAWDDVPPSDATAASLWAEVRRLRAITSVLDEMCVIAKYAGKEGRRDWVTTGSWLHPGDVIAVISQPNVAVSG